MPFVCLYYPDDVTYVDDDVTYVDDDVTWQASARCRSCASTTLMM